MENVRGYWDIKLAVTEKKGESIWQLNQINIQETFYVNKPPQNL